MLVAEIVAVMFPRSSRVLLACDDVGFISIGSERWFGSERGSRITVGISRSLSTDATLCGDARGQDLGKVTVAILFM